MDRGGLEGDCDLMTLNQWVGGSNPAGGIAKFQDGWCE